MTVQLRNYTSEPGFTKDFDMVRDFLIRINKDSIVNPGFIWGRWEWVFSLPYLDKSSLSKIGIWEDNGTIAAVATYEQDLGYAYFLVDNNYAYLKKEMLAYAEKSLCKNGAFKALIPDNDREFQKIALSHGLKPTQQKENNSVLEITQQNTHYVLPKGFTIRSLVENCDLHKVNRVLWRGFNHEGEPPESAQAMEERRLSLAGPHINLDTFIVVVSPEGEYVSFCGTWYDKATDYALVEPVATDPLYRKMGLGKAAVLEAVKRCGKLGAKRAYVGSSQQFYYRIGFSPLPADTFWEH